MDFIFGSELATKVVHLVEGSRQLLLLVSPYFDPWDHLSIEIQNAAAVRKVNTKIVVRGGVDRPRQEPATVRFVQAGAQVHFLERLHAKLYMNEDEAIVTSMNLLKSSAFGSWEIAVRLSRVEDSEQFSALGDCVRKLLQHVEAEEERLRVLSGTQTFDPFMALGQAEAALNIESSSRAPAKRKGDAGQRAPVSSGVRTARAPGRKVSVKHNDDALGHCIRCNASIPLSADSPFCEKHTRSWARTADPDHEERYCLRCGERNQTTKRRPLCESCLEVGTS